MITPDANSVLPSPTVTFGMVNNGAIQAQAGVVPTPVMTDGSLFVDVIPAIGRNLGIALVNPGSGSSAWTLTLRDANGTPVGSPVSINLPAHQQIARFVTELFPSSVIGAAFTGSMRLQGSGSFSALGAAFFRNRIQYFGRWRYCGGNRRKRLACSSAICAGWRMGDATCTGQ